MHSLNCSYEDDEIKYGYLREYTKIFLQLIEIINTLGINTDCKIEIGKSGNFSKYFFEYILSKSSGIIALRPFKERLQELREMTLDGFPTEDYHEGILIEWINIYNLLILSHSNAKT